LSRAVASAKAGNGSTTAVPASSLGGTAGNAAQIARQTSSRTTERVTAAITTRLAPGSDLPVVLRIEIGLTAEIGSPIATRIGLPNDLRIAVEVAA